MSTDPGREAQYDAVRERFLSDPEFRAQFRSDPVGTAQGALGDLSDAERGWIDDLDPGSGTDQELVDRVTGRVGMW